MSRRRRQDRITAGLAARRSPDVRRTSACTRSFTRRPEHPPSAGEILLDGQPASFADASVARERGIEVVYQDLALADQQRVYMNLFLGREPVKGPFRLLDRKRMIAETDALVKELNVRIPSSSATIRDLSGGQRQGVAIARATRWAKKLELLDEPTAALGVALIRKAAAGGARTVALLNTLDSPLGRAADMLLPLAAGPERAVAATKSFVTSLVAVTAIHAGQTGDSALQSELAALPAVLRAQGRRPKPDFRSLARTRRLFCLGRGLGLAIAGEAALKFKETCLLAAEGASTAEFRHGPPPPVGPADRPTGTC